MKPRRVEIIHRETPHRGFFSLDVLTLSHELFRGGMSPPLKRELFHQRQAVAVLPYDPVQDAVVLVEQFRTGCMDAPDGPWTLEGVAGLVDGDELPEATARREVMEETGLALRRLEPVLLYRASPGSTDEAVHTFIAEVAAPAEGGHFGLELEHEDILVHVAPAEAAFEHLRTGRITAANTVIPLLHLMLHHDRLRQAWRQEAPA